MAVPLRVLMVEDQEDDALLAVRQLERGGFAPAWRRVEDAAAMREALAEGPWDVVLSDWSLPAFSGPEALRVLEESGLDVPFLIVSGTVGEDAAIEAMLAGARDYIVKGRLGRLNAAIERELAEHESREARQRAESALARTQTVRTLGQMAAGIAHDLKNILNPLSLHLQLAERAIARGETAAANESIVAMKQVLVRGVETVERLRAYSRSSPDAHRVDVDLDRLVHEAAEITRPRAAARLGRMPRVHEELGGPRPFPGYPAEIVGALVNLIVNAIDALSDGGTITLRTGEDEDSIYAQVSDDGPGMSPEVRARAFEPFFTTKGDEGTGIGLAMVQGCMHRHGGSVTLETTPGEGTTFTLSFPAPLRAV